MFNPVVVIDRFTLMGVEYLVHILGRLSSGQLNPFFVLGKSGAFWSGFLWDNLSSTWNLQPLGCIIYSGLLIWTRVVLQGVSGGALWVVR